MRKVTLRSITKIVTGKLDVNAGDKDGKYPFFTCAIKPHKINNFAFDNEAVLVAGNGDLNVKYYSGKFNAYQRTYVIQKINEAELSMRYLYFFIETYLERLRSGAIGGIIKYIKLGHLADAEIPLPPLEDQKRIASILTRAEKLIAKRKESIQLLDELLKSTFLEMFGDPVRNEKGWDFLELEKICDKIVDCPHSTPKYDNNTGYYCIRSSDIRNGFLDLINTYQVDNPVFEQRIKRYSPQIGDVVYSREGGRLGNAARILTTDKICLGQRIMLFKTNSENNSNYLWSLLESNAFKSKVKGLVGGGAAPRVNIKDLTKIFISRPPLEHQNEFSVIVEKIDYTKAHFQESLIELENFYGSLSQRAFKGELDLSRLPLAEEDETEIVETKKNQEQALQDNSVTQNTKVESENKGFKTVATVALAAGGILLAKKLFDTLSKKEETEEIQLSESYLEEHIDKETILKVLKKVTGQFTFQELWEKTKEAILFEMPEEVSFAPGWEDTLYPHIKTVLFSLLAEKKLSQFFDGEVKEMVLSVNR